MVYIQKTRTPDLIFGTDIFYLPLTCFDILRKG